LINIKRLSKRIKKNEGFSSKPYYDQLGNLTVGYGHLVLKKDKIIENKIYSKKRLNEMFKKDLNEAIENFNKIFSKNKMPPNVSEALIEMIFQLGLKNFLKFKKMKKAINESDFLKASKEMLKSKWYKQTPKRVEGLIKTMEIKID
tara:strand:+ start:195 stop:632 length:438 start_codon:yes stop_codon:yes gene_type:complete